MTESRASETDALTLLRAAAQELLPVVIEIGPEQAKFSSFVGAVEEGNGGYVVLAPVAEALPEVTDQPFRIVSEVGPGWYVVAHRIERQGPQRVRVELAHARAFDSPVATSVAVPAGELLVLVVPGGLHDSSAYVFPVQRIGAEVCEIRLSIALEPGRDLECVEIIGDRRLLRRASAQVLQTVPWYLPDGSRSFSCRLSLKSADGGDATRDRDLVTDPTEMSRLLGLAGTTQCEGWYEAPGRGRGLLRFTHVGKDHVRLALSSLPSRGPIRANDRIRVGVELLALSYELDVRAIESRDGQIVTSLPLILRRRRRQRRDRRVQVASPHYVELSFRNPVTGAVHTHSVVELSYFGVSFDCQIAGAVLWPGLPLEQAQLTWRDRLVHLGDLVVEQYGYDATSNHARCSVSIAQPRIVDDADMIYLLATLAHPGVRMHGPASQSQRALPADTADLVRTFVHGPERAPDASVTTIRAWENSWMLQHFVDGSPELTGATGRLQHACLDHLVPRADGRYLVFFVEADNSAMNAYLHRLLASTGAPEAVTRCTVEVWARATQAWADRQHPSAIHVRGCTRADEVVVAHAAQRCFGAYGAGALSMIPGEIDLPDTARRFSDAGLLRHRTCSLVTRDDESIYAVLAERTTPSTNPLLNATWILPMHPEADLDGAGLDAALASVVSEASSATTAGCVVNLPEGLDPKRLLDWGFSKRGNVLPVRAHARGSASFQRARRP